MSPEAFITGLGMVTPAGLTAATTWAGLVAGGRFLEELALSPHRRIGGQVRSFVPPRDSEHLDRVCQFALAAAGEALDSAGLGEGTLSRVYDPHRVAVSVGTSKGGILTFSELAADLLAAGSPRGRPTPAGSMAGRLCDRLASIPPDAAARCVAERFGVRGGMHATVAACSTGTLSVIHGYHLVCDGRADVVLAGSADASLHPLWFASFDQMGVLAPAHPQRGAAWACRPFDRSRAGFAVGEGAAIMVLESSESVRRRGIRPLARIAGATRATDPTGLIQLEPTGEALARAISKALEQAGEQPDALTCIHAHGTGTVANDRVEWRALRAVLGDATVPVVSIKGAIGHLLGAAGAVELGVAALACRNGVSPGIATLIEPDPELDRMAVPASAFTIRPGPILKTSLGFGGHVAAIILTPE